jgi:hypothetical protein
MANRTWPRRRVAPRAAQLQDLVAERSANLDKHDKVHLISGRCHQNHLARHLEGKENRLKCFRTKVDEDRQDRQDRQDHQDRRILISGDRLELSRAQDDLETQMSHLVMEVDQGPEMTVAEAHHLARAKTPHLCQISGKKSQWTQAFDHVQVVIVCECDRLCKVASPFHQHHNFLPRL